MPGRGSKQKGKRGEREAAEVLRSFGYSAKRGMSFLGEPDIVSDFPMHIEVKYQERLNIFAALEQAEKYVLDKNLPPLYIVAFRKNEGRWFAALPLTDLLGMTKMSSILADLDNRGIVKIEAIEDNEQTS